MSFLKHIVVTDTVSSWIQLVNNIVDTIKLAVAPTKYKEDGTPEDGNDGFLSKEDKKKIDDLSTTYLPISGAWPATSKHINGTFIDAVDTMHLNIDSDDVMVYNKKINFVIDLVPAEYQMYAVKHLTFLPPSYGKYSVTFYLNEKVFTEYTLTYTPNEFNQVVVRVTFVGGTVFVENLTN